MADGAPSSSGSEGGGGAHRCPLCGGPGRFFATAHKKDYHECTVCRLAFMLPAFFVTEAAEVARYKEHNNNPEDAGYRDFLLRAFAPVEGRLPPGASIIDYGSGPVPALAAILRERGYAVETYDKYFAPDEAALARQYDLVLCTETAEHFQDPAREWERLAGLLRPGGTLSLMTGVLNTDADGFKKWWYIRDPTHVVFYRRETLEWIARGRGWAVQFLEKNVTLFSSGSGGQAQTQTQGQAQGDPEGQGEGQGQG
eukprot:tig00000545_g1975.t1